MKQNYYEANALPSALAGPGLFEDVLEIDQNIFWGVCQRKYGWTGLKNPTLRGMNNTIHIWRFLTRLPPSVTQNWVFYLQLHT